MDRKRVSAGLLSLAVASATPLLAANAGECRQLMGGYPTIYAAQMASQQAQNAGYNTSDVWGQGGVISGWQNRRWYFYVFYAC
jgi:hypothetical protein